VPAHALAPAENRRRVEAILRALAEGCAPPSVHKSRNPRRAIIRAAEILSVERTLLDDWLMDYGFPWPEPGQRAKLPADYLINLGLDVAANAEVTPQAAAPDHIELRRLRDQMAAFKARAVAAEARAADAEDAYRTALDLDQVALHPPTWTLSPDQMHGQPGVPCLSLNDWHLGEVVRPRELDGANEYNLEIAGQRIARVIQRTIDLCLEHTRGPDGERAEYQGIVVFANGDMCSGDIHDELRETNEVTRNESVILASEHLVAAVTTLADNFGRVHVCCSPGNHGRDGKPRAKLICATNADFLIYKLAQRFTRKDPRITWDIPESGDFFVIVAGLRIFGTHCDRLGVRGGDGIIGVLGPVARGEIKLGRLQAVLGRQYDVLVGGHYHQDLRLPRVVISNCLIGPNEYSMNILRAPPSPPSQALFFVHPAWGITSHWQIFAGEKHRESFGETPCLA
jgi:hypothetical protein